MVPGVAGRYLGPFGWDVQNAQDTWDFLWLWEEINWRPRIVAVKNVLNSWRQRNLSFRGKALIVNALALARIWYVAGLLHLPAWTLSTTP